MSPGQLPAADRVGIACAAAAGIDGQIIVLPKEGDRTHLGAVRRLVHTATLRRELQQVGAKREPSVGTKPTDDVALERGVVREQGIRIVIGNRLPVDHVEAYAGRGGGIAITVACYEHHIEPVALRGESAGVVGIVAGREVEGKRTEVESLSHIEGQQIARRNRSQKARIMGDLSSRPVVRKGHVLVGRAIAIAVELDLDSLHIATIRTQHASYISRANQVATHRNRHCREQRIGKLVEVRNNDRRIFGTAQVSVNVMDGIEEAGVGDAGTDSNAVRLDVVACQEGVVARCTNRVRNIANRGHAVRNEVHQVLDRRVHTAKCGLGRIQRSFVVRSTRTAHAVDRGDHGVLVTKGDVAVENGRRARELDELDRHILALIEVGFDEFDHGLFCQVQAC